MELTQTKVAVLILMLLVGACGPEPEEDLFEDALRLYRAGQTEQALPLLKETLERDDGNVRALLLVAKIYFYKKDYPQAEEYCDDLLEHQPDHIGALLLKARTVLNDEERAREARRLAERVIEIDPDNIEAWYLKGLLHEKEGQIEEAFTAYKAAIHAGNNLALVHRRLSILYAQADLNVQSRLHGTLARMLAPDDASLSLPQGTGSSPGANP